MACAGWHGAANYNYTCSREMVETDVEVVVHVAVVLGLAGLELHLLPALERLTRRLVLSVHRLQILFEVGVRACRCAKRAT